MIGSVHAEYVAAVYSEIRADEVASEVPHSYTTARTLLSVLRLSQALARLRFADHVDQVSAASPSLHISVLCTCSCCTAAVHTVRCAQLRRHMY